MTIVRVNIHQIKAQLSKYIEMVQAGERVVVCKRNIPVAEIRPLAKESERPAPVLGLGGRAGPNPSQFL